MIATDKRLLRCGRLECALALARPRRLAHGPREILGLRYPRLFG